MKDRELTDYIQQLKIPPVSDLAAILFPLHYNVQDKTTILQYVF